MRSFVDGCPANASPEERKAALVAWYAEKAFSGLEFVEIGVGEYAPELFETRYGIPRELVILAEWVWDVMQEDRVEAWGRRFWGAVPVGVDLGRVAARAAAAVAEREGEAGVAAALRSDGVSEEGEDAIEAVIGHPVVRLGGALTSLMRVFEKRGGAPPAREALARALIEELGTA